MFNIITKEIQWGGRTLTLETGKIARQADGAVLVRYGNTTVLCTAVAAKKPKEGVDFFPLTVVYQEKAFAAGKIPGGFFKREGRPAEKEVLTSRLIDRPIRPLFPDGFYNETQVICTVLSHDLKNDPDVPAMVGASAALAISGIPFNGPIAGVRVGYINGEYVLNPEIGEREGNRLDLVVAGTKQSVMMVESEADELTEQEMLNAVVFGHKQMQPVIKAIEEMAKECGKKRWVIETKDTSELEKQVAKLAEKRMREAYEETEKQKRANALSEIRSETQKKLLEEDENRDPLVVGGLIKHLEQKIVRGNILDSGERFDGRVPDGIRPIATEIGAVPLTHGSALFTRGETQALVVATLGTSQDEQRIDALEGDMYLHFMLHYNFPPYSVGEASMMRAPGRREIGHGKLAWRAVNPLMPKKEEFPYTIRVVSEITESNGSSSMATVCGTSLALMDAGVPLKRACAGIAMGLIMEKDAFAVLSDIMGDEDHLGDMDFKVAGTSEGITSLQMDIKIDGITPGIMDIALQQAKDGRLHILSKMAESIGEARSELNPNAPKVITLQIPVAKIREVIGSGGKVIKEICEVSGAKVDIEDSGQVRIMANTQESADKARAMIDGITAEPEPGRIYDGKVASIVDFGAFVTIMGGKDGLVHISELAPQRVNAVADVVKEGDAVKVKVIGFERGKVRLSMRLVDQETGDDLSDTMAPPRSAPPKKKAF